MFTSASSVSFRSSTLSSSLLKVGTSHWEQNIALAKILISDVLLRYPGQNGHLLRCPSWLLHHSHPAWQPLPLRRGSSHQHPLQPSHQVLLLALLGFHGLVIPNGHMRSAMTNPGYHLVTGFGAPFAIAGELYPLSTIPRLENTLTSLPNSLANLQDQIDCPSHCTFLAITVWATRWSKTWIGFEAEADIMYKARDYYRKLVPPITDPIVVV